MWDWVIPLVLALALSFLALPFAPALGAGSLKTSVGVIGGYENSQVLDSLGNPKNQVLKIPDSKEYIEVRPNIKWTQDRYELVFRPRGVLEQNHVKYQTSSGIPGGPTSDKKETTQKTDVFVTEGFISHDLNQQITTTLGLQNYQWGPAELLSPSNFIFHETIADRKNFAETRGRHLLRINGSPTKTWSTVSLLEWAENKDLTPFGDDQKFKPSFLVKNEYSWAQGPGGGAEYFGFVLGISQTAAPQKTFTRLRWGESFSLQVPWWDGLSWYGDLGHQIGSAAWYPQTNPPVTSPTNGPWLDYDQSRLESSRIYTTGVLGIRYDFVEGEIVRFEYAFDEHSYSRTERALSLQSVQPRNQEGLAALPDNYRKYWNPGIDLKTPEVIYLSFYTPDIASIKDLSGLVRWIYEPFDHSTWGYLSAQYRIGDSGTLSYGGILTTGSSLDQPLRGVASPSHTVAYRHDW